MAEALEHWRGSIQLQPNDAPTLRRAAWVLATSPYAAIRNGGEALAFAVRAVELSGGKDARTLDTLAAAYRSEEHTSALPALPALHAVVPRPMRPSATAAKPWRSRCGRLSSPAERTRGRWIRWRLHTDRKSTRLHSRRCPHSMRLSLALCGPPQRRRSPGVRGAGG